MFCLDYLDICISLSMSACWRHFFKVLNDAKANKEPEAEKSEMVHGN